MAAQIGAQVTGIASPAKADVVMGQGAGAVLARGAPIAADTYDCVIDVVAGEIWGDLIEALKPGGHYAVAGAIGGPVVAADLRRIYLRDITIHGCTYQSPEVFAALIGKVNAGQLRPLVSKTYPMAQIAKAQADFEAKCYAGKLVLLPEGIDEEE